MSFFLPFFFNELVPNSDKPSPDTEWESFPDKKKESGIKPQPEEFTIDDNDDNNVNDKSDSNKKSRKRSPSISKSRAEDIPGADIPSKPKENSKSNKSQTNKVSMVAAIFSARKKKQEEEKVIDEKHKDINHKTRSYYKNNSEHV